MNYNQFYSKKDALKRGRNAEEKANLALLLRAFLICVLAGAAVGCIILVIVHIAS